nr:PREDICTED: C-type mannose receptor 2-like [Apteryx mantelli mantelli]
MSRLVLFLLFGASVLSSSEGRRRETAEPTSPIADATTRGGLKSPSTQRKKTKRAGGHLTRITSAAENEFLHKLTQRQKETQFWTGRTYQKGLSLKWTDGSLTTFIQRPLSSLLRAVKRPLNNLLNNKFCLTLNTGGQGEWGSSVCSRRLPFICVYKPDLMHP